MVIEEIQQDTLPVLLPGFGRGSLREGEAARGRASNPLAQLFRGLSSQSYTNANSWLKNLASKKTHSHTHTHKNSYINVYRSIICKNPKVETMQLSIS